MKRQKTAAHCRPTHLTRGVKAGPCEGNGLPVINSVFGFLRFHTTPALFLVPSIIHTHRHQGHLSPTHIHHDRPRRRAAHGARGRRDAGPQSPAAAGRGRQAHCGQVLHARMVRERGREEAGAPAPAPAIARIGTEKRGARSLTSPPPLSFPHSQVDRAPAVRL